MSEQNSGEQPPRPRYGEYAPPGYQPPNAEPAQPAGPTGQPAAPAWPTPQHQQQPGWTQPSGQPGWSQPGTPQGQSSYDPSNWGDAAKPAKRRNLADLIVTIVLLVLGLLGVGIAVVYGVIFSSPELIDEAFRQQGRGGFSGNPGAFPAVIIISHVVLYLVAAGLSILQLVKRRLAFWIPLTAGVVAAIVFWICLVSIIATDPALVSGSAGG